MFNAQNSGYSLADVGALLNNRNDDCGFGNNGAWWIIVLFLFIFMGGWGRNGFGYDNGYRNGTDSGIYDNYVLNSDFASLRDYCQKNGLVFEGLDTNDLPKEELFLRRSHKITFKQEERNV